MELTRIDIIRYKSIKQPCSIVFKEGQVVTLIGKNGSGKTNILEALQHIFDVNAHTKFYLRAPRDIQYKVYLNFNEDDVESILPNINYDKDKSELIAYNCGEGLKIDTLESEYLVPLLKQEIDNIQELTYKLKDKLNEYVQLVNSIKIDDNCNNSLIGFSLQNDHLTNFHILKNNIEYNIKQALDLVNNLIKQFDDDNKTLHFLSNNYINFFGIENLKFQLEYDEPVLSQFEQKYIQINKRAIKRAITEINKRTSNCCEQITKFAKHLSERAKFIENALDADEIRQSTKEEKYYSFLKKVQMCIGRRCLFLRNDNNSELLFGERNSEQYYQQRNNTNYILETYLRQIYKGDDKEDLLKTISDGKAIELTNKAILKFENYLNINIPKFEQGMFSGVKIEYNNRQGIFIKIKEKDELIDLNSTSAGRRWYFTYYFMKNILQKGDVFIIDEPAGMLHPSAQQEVLEELKDLALRGIKVIYSTHSPYMIIENWDQIHSIKMDSDIGTSVNNFTCKDDLQKIIRGDLGISKTVNILFNLEKTIILVEGVADKVCLEKFAALLNRDLSDYYIHVCDGEAILQVAYICLKNEIINVKVVLDNDNKYKSEHYRQGHSMYEQCIETINANGSNCVYIGHGEKGCLEDLFIEKPNTKFKKQYEKGQWKVDKDAINSLNSIDEVSRETREKFEELFNNLDIPKLKNPNL